MGGWWGGEGVGGWVRRVGGSEWTVGGGGGLRVRGEGVNGGGRK